MGNLCSGHIRQMETRSAQTDLNPFYKISNRDLINARFQNPNYKIHTKLNNTKLKTMDNIQLKNTILTDWRHPNRCDMNYSIRSDFMNGLDNNNVLQHNNQDTNRLNYDFYPKSIMTNKDSKLTGVWPINGCGDNNNEFQNIKKQRKIPTLSREFSQKSDYDKSNINITDEVVNDNDDNSYEHDDIIGDNINNRNNYQQFSHDMTLESPNNNNHNIKTNRKCNSSKSSKNKEQKMKSKKSSSHRIRSSNSNSNNYTGLKDDKNVNNSNNGSQKFHSSSLLDQDCYPIQYTFYVDDNDACTKPFYDRRMVAIAKTCRCRIYFHAKSHENEKPLYFKGKPVRPVTITSPDMACLKRCLGSIDSQFPYFNCKAFLSLSS